MERWNVGVVTDEKPEGRVCIEYDVSEEIEWYCCSFASVHDIHDIHELLIRQD